MAWQTTEWVDKTKFPPKGITENQRENRKVSMNALDLSGKGKAKTYNIEKNQSMYTCFIYKTY